MKKTTLKDVQKIINSWMKTYKGQVFMVGSFMAFDKEGEISEDIMFAFGDKKPIKTLLSGISQEIKNDKQDFLNW